MEENVMSEKKKSSVGKVIVIILIIIVSAVGGWFGNKFYQDKVADKDKKIVDKNKDKELDEEKKVELVELKITNQLVVDLFSGLDTLGTTMQVNNCASLDFDYFKAGKVTTATLDKNTATYVALKHLQKDGLNFSEGATFTKKQMHDAVEKVFGKDYNYTDGNIVNCPSITYDASSETYKVGPAGCGGSCGAVSMKKLVKAVQIGEIIELEVRVIFADSNGNYYSDYSKTNKIQVKYETDGIISSSSIDMGSLYKVTFKKENENYIFVSSDISR